MSYDTKPSTQYFSITPSDSVNYDKCRALYVGVSGNVQAVQPNGTVVPFLNAVAGSVLPIETIRINATSTTATDLVGLY